MDKPRKRKRRLTDAYAFPGFRPKTLVRGVFGDPKARIVTLVRRSKKRSAVSVDGRSGAGMIDGRAKFAICPAATRAFIWSLKSGAWTAAAAAR